MESSAMEASSATLMSFPKDDQTSLREAYPGFELAVWDLLEGCYPAEHGILWFAMSGELYTALTGEAEFRPVEHPGALPDNATQPQTAVHKYRMEQYEKQQRALKWAKSIIIAKLNPEATDLITDGVRGTRGITLRGIMDRLRDTYGVLSTAELKHQKNILLVPYKLNTPIRDYVRIHRDVHRVLETAGQPLAMADKVEALKGGVKHVPIFVAAVQHYTTTYPRVAEQTFQLLTNLLGQAEDNGEPMPTTGSAGYAAASTAQPEAFSMATVGKMIEVAVAQALKDNKPPSTKANKPRSEGRPYTANNYCWTHGPCKHASLICTSPKEGHKREATDGNRMGGAETKWSRNM